MDNCKICANNFQDSSDEIVLCEHKEGMVHLGCCRDLCSQDKQPCRHKRASYSKKD